MTVEIVIVLALVVVAVTLFATEKLPVDWVALNILPIVSGALNGSVLLILTKCINMEET